ncbi:hypothetical protein B1R94_23480 [Mycolicibacterium litorale]|nr:hypothetical protein B1R94_23480 [Mycolicibacterium litorale]
MMKTLISSIFRVSVLTFLVGGAVVVLLQAAGLVLGDGDFVDAVSDTVAPWAYGAAGVAGLLAFALSYFPHGDTEDAGADQETAAPVPEHA